MFDVVRELSWDVTAVAGGWPCQDVFFLNKHRSGAEGSRYALFREYIRIPVLTEEMTRDRGMQFVGLGGCTRMSIEDQEKTGELGWVRPDICPSGASRVRWQRNS